MRRSSIQEYSRTPSIVFIRRVSLFGNWASCRHADIELKKRSHKRFSLRRERDTLTWECLRKAYALMGKPRRFEPFFPVMLCRIIYIMSTDMGKRRYWASPRALFSGSVIGSDHGDGLGQRVWACRDSFVLLFPFPRLFTRYSHLLPDSLSVHVSLVLWGSGLTPDLQR